MATAQGRERLSSRLKMLMFDDDDATSNVLHYTSWQALEDVENVMIGVMFAAGTGLLSGGIYVASSSAGADVAALKMFTAPTTADAVGDWRFAEVGAEQVAQAGAAAGVVYTHFSAGITADAGSDEFAVVYIIAPGRFKYSGLTADVTA